MVQIRQRPVFLLFLLSMSQNGLINDSVTVDGARGASDTLFLEKKTPLLYSRDFVTAISYLWIWPGRL